MAKAALIHINGAPGVGKLTIARYLAPLLRARLVDNHLIYNPAFALAMFRSPEFYEAVRAVRSAVYDQIAGLPPLTPVILTDAYFDDSPWALESWGALLDLAARRPGPLLTVALRCDAEEHRRRVVTAERAAKGKIQDPAYVSKCLKRRLIAKGGDASTTVDVTNLEPDQAAALIAQWVEIQLHQGSVDLLSASAEGADRANELPSGAVVR